MDPQQARQRPNHKIALQYVHGKGRRPTDKELVDVRPDLIDTVHYVDSLIKMIDDLQSQVAHSLARIECLSKSREEIVGAGAPCGRVMHICGAPCASSGLYCMCIMPGMPIYEGRCAQHASARPTSYAEATTGACARARDKK